MSKSAKLIEERKGMPLDGEVIKKICDIEKISDQWFLTNCFNELRTSMFHQESIALIIRLFEKRGSEIFEDIEPNELTLTEQGNKDVDEMEKEELVTHPARYTGKSGMQVFDIINEYGMDFYEGNALKYLIQYKKKNGLEDLKDCRDYIDYLIERYKK